MKVYQAIGAVSAAMSHDGITKARKNTQQGYNFRGIDDVLNALSAALVSAGLVILPRCTDRVVIERETQKGGVLFNVTCRVEFDLVSTEDGSKHTVCTYGEAMDSADKATNKAMSAAYKYLALLVFCIPTEATTDTDADYTTHEVKAAKDLRASGPAIVFAALQPEEQDLCRKIAAKVKTDMPDMAKVLFTLDMASLENEMKTGVWHLLDAPTRSAIKAAQAARDQAPALAK